MMKRFLVVLLMMLLWQPAVLADDGVRWIDGGNADRVHLRAAPSTSADSLGLYFTGTGLTALEQSGSWSRVRICAEEGWIMTKYLTGTYIAPQGPWYQVDNPSSTWVNLRMEPSMNALVAMCPENGTRVQVLGETADGWYYVDCQGVKGYILASLLSEAGQMPLDTTVLGVSADGWYIYECIAPNGQRIVFTAMDDRVDVYYEDVNCDCVQDIVAVTVRGASNAFAEFFVYEASSGMYVRARTYGSDDRLCNYQLLPQMGLVVTQTNYGNAGATHEYCIYRWEGTDLQLLRSAESDVLTVEVSTMDCFTETTYTGIYHVVVRDFTRGGYDEAVIWEVTVSRDEYESRDIYNEEMSILWQGIK